MLYVFTDNSAFIKHILNDASLKVIPAECSGRIVEETKESVWASHRDVLGQPLGDVQVVDLQRDLLAVSRFGDSDGRQILRYTEKREFNRTRGGYSPAGLTNPGEF